MAEVIVGAKTGPFSAGLDRMRNQWAAFKGSVSKKFSIADAGKGFMQGLGIGSAIGLIDQLAEQFQKMIDRAELFAAATSNAYANTRALLGLRMNPQQSIKSDEKDIALQKSLIKQQEKFLQERKDSPFRWTPGGMSAVDDAEKKLTDLKNTLGQSEVSVEQKRIAERKRQENLAEQRAALDDQRAILRRTLTPEGAARNAEARALNRLIRNAGGPDSEERLIAANQATLELERAHEARRLAQLGGIKADSLARIGGGGGVLAASGERGANPAQAILSESAKHTKLLTTIATNTKGGGLRFDLSFRR